MAKRRNINPLVAFRDLRDFLKARSRHELLFGILAMSVTIVLVLAFLDNRGLETQPKREITYVQDWPLDRSLEQIQRQSAIDAAAKAEREERLEALRAERRAEFQKVEDALNRYGL